MRNTIKHIFLAFLLFALGMISGVCLFLKVLKVSGLDSVKRVLLLKIIKLLYGKDASGYAYRPFHKERYDYTPRAKYDKKIIIPVVNVVKDTVKRPCEICGEEVTKGYTDGEETFYAHEGECFTKYMNNMYGEGCWHPTKDDETDAYGGYYVADPFDEPTGIYYTEWEEEQ